MHNSDIFSKLDISYKSLSYIESNSFKLYKGEKEVISNRNTPGIRISIDGDAYFNIKLIEELIGE
jgi:NADPH-dependent 7-cyano-7-deazaguanine reductase QueF-like protein